MWRGNPVRGVSARPAGGSRRWSPRSPEIPRSKFRGPWANSIPSPQVLGGDAPRPARRNWRIHWRVFGMHGTEALLRSKVPQVTLAFWIIKIAATTLGETAGDALSMTENLGYALSTAIFFAIFLATVAAQIRARAFHSFLYWAVIVATTTAGTTMADFADRSLGIGY